MASRTGPNGRKPRRTLAESVFRGADTSLGMNIGRPNGINIARTPERLNPVWVKQCKPQPFVATCDQKRLKMEGKMSRLLKWVCLAALLLGASLQGCGGQPEQGPVAKAIAPPEETPPGTLRLAKESLGFVKTQIVGKDVEHIPLRAPGRVQFRDGAMSRVGAPVPARVQSVHVAVGQLVHAGEPLVTLDSPQAASLRADLERGRLQIRLASELARRQRDMVAKGVGIDSERFAAEMAVAQAQADLVRAEKSAHFLGDGKGAEVILRAPIDGNVLLLRATVGATVDTASEPLVELGNAHSLWVVADVFEQDVQLVHIGAEVSVDLPTANTPVQANVASIGGRVETGMRRAPVYIAFDQGIDLNVRPGMYALVKIAVESAAGVTVPATAVLVKDGTRNIVYVARSADLFEARDVHLGRSSEGRVELIGGVKAGEKIVIEGALLIDGSAEQRQ